MDSTLLAFRRKHVPPIGHIIELELAVIDVGLASAILVATVASSRTVPEEHFTLVSFLNTTTPTIRPFLGAAGLLSLFWSRQPGEP